MSVANLLNPNNLTIYANKLTPNSILFAGLNETSLSKYEKLSGTLSLDFSGAFSATFVYDFTIIGDICILRLFGAYTAAVSSTILTSAALPTRLIPSINYDFPIMVQTATSGTRAMGLLHLSGLGVITVGADLSDATFTSGQTCGFATTEIIYKL